MGIIQSKLKEYRKTQRLTQAKVAKMLGVTQQTYQEWESGKIEDLRSSTVIRLCEALNLSADWLLGLRETKVIEFPGTFTVELDVGNAYYPAADAGTDIEETPEG